MVFQCARSCLGCCIKNYKGSTRIIKRPRHAVNDCKWYQRRNRNNISPSLANNEFMGAEFDPTKESKFIWYLDVNGLYSWAMSKPLPTSGFEWMTDDGIDNWKHLNSILDVYLEYLEELHDLHNDYSLAPERVKMRNVEKLIPNFNKKTNCVAH